MNTQQFKNRLREVGDDVWADALDAWFEVAGRLHTRRILLPYDWKYEPPFIGTPCRKESPFFKEFKESKTAELKQIGSLLYRYLLFLKSKGLNEE